MEKKCSRCQIVKDISEFGIHRIEKDGRNSNCKQCNIDRVKEYSKNNKEKVAATHKKYHREHYEAIKKMQKAYLQTERGKEVTRKSDRTQRLKFTEKFRARYAVQNATRRGKIPPASSLSCVVCGKQAQHYHHHNGYDKEHRMDVIPVCDPCHKSIE